MKKYYIFLSVISVVLIGFTVLTIFYFHDYIEITKEIYDLEIDHTLAALFVAIIPSGDKTPIERPDTSGLQAQANHSLTLGIIFLVIAISALALLIIILKKILKNRKQQANKDITSSGENTGIEVSL